MMKISSENFKNLESIPGKFTCDGANINPKLIITEVPEGTKSLALIVDDPDASGGTWIHWLVWNISPDTKTIQEDSIPASAVKGTNSSGRTTYGGPCPPTGTHHYFFKLYALDISLNLPASARNDELELAMRNHILDQADLVGLYARLTK